MNWRLIALLGVVSLFTDWLYESMRAITPQYLQHLGATALLVGFVFGLGDAVGYAARLFTGPLADRRGGYWLETFLGYSLQVGAVAGLIFVRDMWQVAALVFLERFSKALRTPARDAIIASTGAKKGTAFGIHAALDQIGAVIGVVMATVMLYLNYGPRDVYTASILPGLMALVVLYIAYRYRLPVERRTFSGLLNGDVIRFGISQLFLGASLIHISISMYKLSDIPWMAALLYAIAMAAEIFLSPALGALYDIRRKTLLIGPIASAIYAAFFQLGGLWLFPGSIPYSLVTAYADVVAKAQASKLGGASSLGAVSAMWGFGLLTGGIIYGFYVDAGLQHLALLTAMFFSSVSLAFLWRRY